MILAVIIPLAVILYVLCIPVSLAIWHSQQEKEVRGGRHRWRRDFLSDQRPDDADDAKAFSGVKHPERCGCRENAGWASALWPITIIGILVLGVLLGVLYGIGKAGQFVGRSPYRLLYAEYRVIRKALER